MKVRPTFGDNQLDYAGHDEEGERGEPRVKPQHKQNRKRDFCDADDMGDHDRRGKAVLTAEDMELDPER